MDRLIIFDFDGVIALNTEQITMEVIASLVERPVEEVASLVMGMGGKMLVDTLNNVYGKMVTEEQIMFARMEIMDRVGVLKKDPTLVPFLKELKKDGIKYIIATSSSKPPIYVALKRLELEEYFKNIYSIDDYPNFKSKRELYKMIGTIYPNSEIFIIEDSLRGIECAYDSGIGKVIAYTGGDESKQFDREYFKNIDEKVIGIFSNFKKTSLFVFKRTSLHII